MDVHVEEYRFQGGGSNKYWRVATAPKWTLIQYGRMGNNPQATIGVIGVPKKIAEKMGKGYYFAGTEVIELPDHCNTEMQKSDAKAISNEVEAALNTQSNDDWGGIARYGSTDNKPSRRKAKGNEDVFLVDEAQEVDEIMRQDSLSQRAFNLMSQAATDPEGALVEFAILREEAEALRAEADEAGTHVNTLAMMLGLEERV